jgi:hypothetical protein
MIERQFTNTLSCILLLAVAGVGRAGSLVGYWSFDEGQGTIVHDLSGTGNDGTVNGSPQWIQGYLGGGLQLNGSTDYVDCGNAENLNITENITVSAWVKTVDAGESGDQLGDQNHYVSKWDAYGIKHRTNLLIFWVFHAGGWRATRISIDNSFNDEWRHVVGTYDGKVLKTYVDGKFEGDLAYVGAIARNQHPVLIGKNPSNTIDNFEGGVDEVRIYNRDLSASQVQDLFQGNVPSFARAFAPQPADGARGVAMPMLTWTAGEEAAMHEVYFGVDPNLTEADYQGPRNTAAYWHIPGLASGQTYYWRVDEVTTAGVKTTGKVWSFTAASPKAYDPQPRDGAMWLNPAGVQLTWEFGTDAKNHDVYFGADRAAVEAGDASVFVGNQAPSLYESGVLENNTVYYWRIDEQSFAGAVQKGDVWMFSTSGGPYDGVRAEYFSNADLTGEPVVVRTEPAINFEWPEGATEGVNSPAAGVPVNNYSARWSAELQVAYSGEYRFVVNVNNSGRLWLDGRLLIDRWPNDGTIPEYTTKSIPLTAGSVYSLIMEWNKFNTGSLARLEWIDPFGDRAVIPAGALQLALRANRPSPNAGQTGVSDTAILRWSPGDKAAGHDVYFGDSAEAVAAADAASDLYQGRQSLDETTFEPAVLEWGQTYSWRIDEVNDADAASPWKGCVWSFTVADFLVIDDFESYTDDEGGRIYETWIDGYTDSASNSVVGYLTAPFAEQTIVHAGHQSMPLDYNNVDSPHFSQAERTWDAAQNWTVNGVDTLTLSVRGRAGNAAERLYVALEDSTGRRAVAAHPDPSILAATKWNEWKIPLSQFTGVNAARIKTLVIGVGDPDVPTPGGAGRLYFDDFRVTKGQ